ncbi:unnamed protein product [Caenorhabditis bovis]|uniref:ER membrane protein complex subunit 1 n=1 Tax=Caenorhabditis bovis TaxID=2654633 RepID=A0A8S1FCS0_9PELO|nr:unnamed protein product [Caenorhabditis bovis]
MNPESWRNSQNPESWRGHPPPDGTWRGPNDGPKPPTDHELRTSIEKTAQSCARNGPQFENMMRETQRNNPKFAFLFGGPGADYYQYQLNMAICQIQAQVPPPSFTTPPPPTLVPPGPSNLRKNLPSLMDTPEITKLKAEIEEFRAKIADSENNLKAHKESLEGIIMNHLKSSIRTAEQQKIAQLLHAQNLDTSEFSAQIENMNNSKCSKDTITQAKKWIFEHCCTDQLREIILMYLLDRVKDVNASEFLRLHVLYLINDWAFHCQRKHEDNQMKMLTRYVPKLYAYCMEYATSAELREKLEGKLAGEWEGRGYFNDSVFKQIRNPSSIVKQDQDAEICSYKTTAESIRSSLMATYEGYEQQHNSFSQHCQAKIDELNRQINEHRHGPSPHSDAFFQSSRRSRFDQTPQERKINDSRMPTTSTGGWTEVSEEMTSKFGADGDDIDGMPFDENALKPNKSYLALPAGIMVPLVNITDFTYEPIDPEKLEMPPMIPPSQRLLAAREAFYKGLNLDTIVKNEEPFDDWGIANYPSEFLEKKRELKKKVLERLKSLEDVIKNRPNSDERRILEAEEKRKYNEMIDGIKQKVEDYYAEQPTEPEETKKARSSATPSLGFRSSSTPLSNDNKGAQLMAKMGWNGKGLGVNESGIVDPINGGEIRVKVDQFRGLGSSLDPYEQFRRQRSDQAGKFDWRKQFIGCPKDAYFERGTSGTDKVIFTTEEDILAGVSLNTGEIAWRRVFEKKPTINSNSMSSTSNEKIIYTMSNGGQIVRSWRKSNGVLRWQMPLGSFDAKIADIVWFEKFVAATTEHKIAIFNESEKNEQKKLILEHVLPFKTNFAKFVKSADGRLLHVSAVADSSTFHIRHIDVNEKTVTLLKSIDMPQVNVEKCSRTGDLITCYHSDSLMIVNPANSKAIQKSTGVAIRDVQGHLPIIVVRGSASINIFSLKTGNLESVGEISGIFNVMNSVSDANYLVAASKSKLIFISLTDGKLVYEIPLGEDAHRVAPRTVFASSVGKSSNEFEVVLVGDDCRIEMLVTNGKKKHAVGEWTRDESLIRVSSVEMVDLPLSESQQLIEDEFEGDNQMALTAFLRRIMVQFGQVRRWAIRTIEQVFSLGSVLSTRANGLSDLINAVRSNSPSTTSSEGPFERDYFNLRKLIVLTTLDGVVFGIDSANGNILWRMHLGDAFAPLRSSLGELHVPLFVQRTTAHYQLDGQAAVVFKNAATSNGIIVAFNPMNGKIVERKELAYAIKKVSLLPFVDSSHIHSVLTISNQNQISYYPEVSREILNKALPLHILDATNDGRSFVGYQVDFEKRALVQKWSGNLGLSPNDQIVTIKGKPFNQRVHSQGRVLVDRDVQFKYINPNLAAIAALDPTTQILTIILVDVVTGQIVHSANANKATGPIRMVHSEHWIAFSHWSEKHRRTELGIIELYEASNQQSMKEAFDSKLPTKKPPVVIANSYIYSQEIDAMSVSETEQGLTTKSILIALPSGSIHEVSRKLLDATRPLELTAAMREEMMIGYVPELAIATEEMINYNQTVHRVRAIKTAPSGLESTSLVLAYGTDIFFTRLTPSGTFDILKDDFDHLLISTVLAALIIGSYISKRLARSHALTAQWATVDEKPDQSQAELSHSATEGEQQKPDGATVSERKATSEKESKTDREAAPKMADGANKPKNSEEEILLKEQAEFEQKLRDEREAAKALNPQLNIHVPDVS